MEAVYQSIASFCFTLMGPWSGVVSLRRREWLFGPAQRRMAHSVYLGFFLPAVMSLLAATEAAILSVIVFPGVAHAWKFTMEPTAEERAGASAQP